MIEIISEKRGPRETFCKFRLEIEKGQLVRVEASAMGEISEGEGCSLPRCN